jgi:hypothetical protein
VLANSGLKANATPQQPFFMPTVQVHTWPMTGFDDLTEEEFAAVVTALRGRSTTTAILCPRE